MSSQGCPIIFSESEITFQSTETVLPSMPTPTGTHYLSNIDLTVMFPVETVYFFGPHHSKSTDKVVEQMQRWLGDVLVPYHFLAGRLRTNHNENGRLELDCNRAGVLYRGASSSSLSLSDLGDLSLPNPSFNNLIISTAHFLDITHMPLFTMQVTRFKCGGFCLGMSTYHCMFDGIGAAEFVDTLSRVCTSKPVQHKPNFDRTCLKPRIPPIVSFAHTELIPLETGILSSFTKGFIANNEENKRHKEKQGECRCYRFSRQDINKLREKAKGRSSSFEVLAGHVWQTRTKAMASSMSMEDSTSMLFAVNVRHKMGGIVPEHYAGNAVVTAEAKARVADLVKEELCFAVREVQTAVGRVNEDYARSCVDWLEVKGGGIPNAVVKGNFYLSAWWKLGFYDMDLGWGTPLFAGPVSNGMAEFVVFLSNADNSGVDVWLILQPHEMLQFDHFVSHF